MRNLSILIVFVILSGCARVPMTNRRQAKMIPASQMQSMSYQQYAQFMQQHTRSTNSTYVNMVKNSGKKIKDAVVRYMNSHARYRKRIKGYAWEFNVVEDNQLNAWCMPGGKVCFYTGILPVCQNEEGVAVVMGHEIAHAIAAHGNERMSQGMMAQGVGLGLSVFMANKPAASQELFNKAFGIGLSLIHI